MTEDEIDLNKEYRDSLKKYCENLLEIINKSNEQFEKQLSFISGGALALSFIVIEKVLKDFLTTKCKWILIVGWSSLVITLLLNLYSHKRAIDYHNRSLTATNEFLADPEINFEDKEKEIENRKKRIERMNNYCLIFLSLGLISLIVYTSINLYV